MVIFLYFIISLIIIKSIINQPLQLSRFQLEFIFTQIINLGIFFNLIFFIISQILLTQQLLLDNRTINREINFKIGGFIDSQLIPLTHLRYYRISPLLNTSVLSSSSFSITSYELCRWKFSSFTDETEF